MFGPLGLPEVLFILVLALLIFGPKRLPEIGRTIGKGLGEFRRASNELKNTLSTELEIDEGLRSARSTPPSPVRPAPRAIARPTVTLGAPPAPATEPEPPAETRPAEAAEVAAAETTAPSV